MRFAVWVSTMTMSLTLVAAGRVSAAPGDDPHRLLVSSHGVTTNGSVCGESRFWQYPTGQGGGAHSDCFRPPSPSGSVPVHGEGELLLETGVTAAQVMVRLGRPDGTAAVLESREADSTHRRFLVTLTPGCAAGRLEVEVRYENYERDDGATERGAVDFFTGMTEHRHGRPLCPGARVRLSARTSERYADQTLSRRFGTAFRRRVDYRRRCGRLSADRYVCRVSWVVRGRHDAPPRRFRGTVAISRPKRDDGAVIAYRLRIRRHDSRCDCSQWVTDAGDIGGRQGHQDLGAR